MMTIYNKEEFEKLISSNLKVQLNIYCNFHFATNKKEIFCIEFHSTYKKRLVELDYLTSDKELFWLSLYDGYDEYETGDMWSMFEFPIIYSEDEKEIFRLSNILEVREYYSNSLEEINEVRPLS